jgi:NADH-quinone oxidoreductase subunit C
MPSLTPAQIAQRINDAHGSRLQGTFLDKHPRVHTLAEHWRELAAYLKNDPQLRLDWLANLSGMDYVADAQMAVVYDLWSFEHDHRFAVKVFTPREKPSIPSVADLWPAADWHEREAYDMFGIDFPGHPDLRRILLADDWEGFPLRKDYVFPREYHGIPGTVEPEWQPKAK